MTKEKDLKKSFEKTMRKHKGNKKAQLATIVVFGLIAIVSMVFDIDITGSSNLTTNGTVEISYLDVGQGDATYIKVNDMDILIDAGSKSDVDKLMKQLEEKNIDDFEIVVSTHPHEDHIGGMTKVLQTYKVESFYMPKVEHSTKTFENMIKEVEKQGLKVKVLKEGVNIDVGEGALLETFSPTQDSYSNLNNYSPIMKLTFGNNSFLFTGDAEKDVEAEVLSKYKDKLDSDVIKFGHHGSSTSSSQSFIEAVSPDYGIISCGVDNSYGHPHKEILKLIQDMNIEAYRTDTQGQITVISDGNSIDIKTEK